MRLRFSTLSFALCEPVAQLIKVCFPQMPAEDQYSVEDLEEMAEIFPKGTVVVIDEETNFLVGMGTGIFTDLDFNNLPEREHELLYSTEDVSLHNPQGGFYYGSDICVHPDYRGRGIAGQIYDRRKQLVIDHNKRGFAGASTLPGFEQLKGFFRGPDYVEKVISGELYDPTLSVQIRNGFEVVRALKDFYRYPRSDNWSALVVWWNPHFAEAELN